VRNDAADHVGNMLEPNGTLVNKGLPVCESLPQPLAGNSQATHALRSRSKRTANCDAGVTQKPAHVAKVDIIDTSLRLIQTSCLFATQLGEFGLQVRLP
jgi:hypothetical protein